MRVHIETLLPCSVEQAWEMIQSSAHIMEVTPGGHASAIVEPKPMPAQWTDASRIVLQIPKAGKRIIEIELVDPAAHVIQTREHDSVVKQWLHRMQVKPGPNGQAYYSDTVDIAAGIMTIPVYALAQYLYRYRHRGWLRIARHLASTDRA